MLCKRCMTVMEPGTSYGQRKDGRPSTRRFHECKKCHDRLYTNEPNLQEYMSKAAEKSRNR